jgi:hypothetical protein
MARICQPLPHPLCEWPQSANYKPSRNKIRLIWRTCFYIDGCSTARTIAFYIDGCVTQWNVALRWPIFKQKKVKKVHIHNVERQNVERQNIERQNVERQNVDTSKRRHIKTSTHQNVDNYKISSKKMFY